MKHRFTRRLAGAILVAAGMCVVAPAMAQAPAQPAPSKDAKDKGATDSILIFRSGRTMQGQIVSETASSVKFRSSINGLAFETDYDKSDILDIKRGVKPLDNGGEKPADGDKTGDKIGDKAGDKADGAVPPADGVERNRYYWIDLKGKFGEDISQTPIRNAVKDAHANKADTIIMMLDAEFNPREMRESSGQKDSEPGAFDEIFRAEHIVPIFAEEIPREWEKQPRVVIWVKQAMGGAALLPFICPEIYFHSEGRMGGLGNLSSIFEGVGDEVVREKQRSLRLGHAEGWAIKGGYDYRLVRAMARVEYVLSVRFVNGKAELFEGLPTNPGEELLTDDGKDANKDTDAERAAGEGNDVLTFNARTAKMLGLSRDTVDTKDDLLVAMGIDRIAQPVPGRSKAIMKDWSDGLDNAKRKLKNLLDDFRRVRVENPGDYAARTKARGKQTMILNEIKATVRRWSEGLSPRWLGENGIPPEDQIDTRLEQIKIDQQKDKR